MALYGVTLQYENNKDADQPAHLCSLINIFDFLSWQFYNYTSYIYIFKILASLCSWVDQFVYYQAVKNQRAAKIF